MAVGQPFTTWAMKERALSAVALGFVMLLNLIL